MAVLASAQSSVFLNFHDDGKGNSFVSQSASKCDSCSYSKVLAALTSTSGILDSLLKDVWKPASLNGETYGTISFNSDIDFGERTSYLTNTCIKNHTPLSFKADRGEIKGNGFTVRNLCHVDSVLSEETRMSQPIGLFSKLESVTVSDLNFYNAYFKAFQPNNGQASPSATWFYGVGALAGEASESSVSKVSFEKVAVLGVIAGGVFGSAQNSTFKEITTVDSVYVSTSTAMSSYYSGKFDSLWQPRYTTYLGGIVGYGINLNFANVILNVKISPVAYFNDRASIGGLAGVNILSKEKSSGSSDWVYVKDSKVTSYAMEKGAATGGFFGEVGPYGGSSESLNMSISGSTFEGPMSNGFVDSTYAGGFVGRNALYKNTLKIVGGTSNITVRGNNSYGYRLQGIGGFVGASVSYGNSAVSYLSITGSTATGSISFTQDYGNSSYVQKYYAGGLVGYGHFAAEDNAIVNDSADVNIVVSMASKDSDSVAVGGLVGLALAYGTGADLLVSNAAYTGSIHLDGSLGHVYAGGAVGHYHTEKYDNTIVFEYVRAKNDSLISIGTRTTSTATKGVVFAGGLCGECESTGDVKGSGVFGNITMGGSSASRSLHVGGLAGSFFVGYKDVFSMANNYYVGLQTATVVAASKVVGYWAGAFGLRDKTIDYSFTSNYHFGTDQSYAFGVVDAKDDDIYGEKYFNHVVRNGESDTLDANSNGIKSFTSMTKSAMADFLNEPWEDTVWLYDKTINNGYPYQKVIARTIAVDTSSTEEPKSSSSEKDVVSSSSEKEVSSSSSAKSSSSEMAEVSSSSEKVTSSSSAEPESSSSKIVASSSSEKEITSSSSEKEIASSSSVKISSSSAEVVVSSSSNVVASSSSAEVVEPSTSSSEKFVVTSSSSSELKESSASAESSSSAEVASSSTIDSSSSVERSSSSEKIESSSEEMFVSSSSEVMYGSSSSVESSSSAEPESSAVEWVEISSSSEVEYSSSQPVIWYAGSWNMVSLKAIKQNPVALNKNDYLYWWDEHSAIGEYWQYRSYRFRGYEADEQGYWYQGVNDFVVENSPIPEGAEIVWKLDSANSGWNMVANPYGQSIDLSCDELKDVIVWRWNNSEGYEPASKVLGPYEGAWVKVSAARTIRFVAKPAVAKKVLQKSTFAEAEGWSLKAVLSDDYGKADVWNVMGTASREVKVDEPPAGMGSYVRLSIVENQALLAKSLKTESDEMSWNVRLSASNSRDGFLQLEGVDALNAMGKKVYVSVDGRTIEMKEGNSVKVALKTSAKTAVVTVTSGEKSVVASNGIRNLRGIRSANGMDVNFEITGALMGDVAKIDVVGISGKVVATAKKNATAGINSVNLNVRERGLYIVRVRVGSQNVVKNINLQ